MSYPETDCQRMLARLGACDYARAWVADRDLESSWAECHDSDWLLWLAARMGTPPHEIVVAACACARTVLHLAPAGDPRPRLALEAAEAWARGYATVNQVHAAVDAARAARTDAWVEYSADDAYAEDAAYAAASAAAYAANATASAARAASRVQCCDAIRSAIPCPTIATFVGGHL